MGARLGSPPVNQNQGGSQMKIDQATSQIVSELLAQVEPRIQGCGVATEV
jgi:hypothetical protein